MFHKRLRLLKRGCGVWRLRALGEERVGCGEGEEPAKTGPKPSTATAEISGQAGLMHIVLPLPRGLGSFRLWAGSIWAGWAGSISACCALDLDTAEGWILAGYFLAGPIRSNGGFRPPHRESHR